MAGKSGSFVYPSEDDVIKLRKGFRLTADGYLSKGSLLYVLETVQDLSSKDYEEALVAKAAYILFNVVTAHPFIDGNKRTASGSTISRRSMKLTLSSGSSFTSTTGTGRTHR